MGSLVAWFRLPCSVREAGPATWDQGPAGQASEGPGGGVRPRAQACPSLSPAGSLCGEGTGACYQLPVLDTVFVRRGHRRQGLGVAMLQDFCATFRDEEALGVSWPISPAMYQGEPTWCR